MMALLLSITRYVRQTSLFFAFLHYMQHTLIKFSTLVVDTYEISTCQSTRGHRGHDCKVVGFTTTHAISTYHH
jgi:hypothetical protein